MEIDAVPKGYWRVFPQEEGAWQCLRHATATALQIHPNELPVSGTFLGDQLEQFNAKLRAKQLVQLVEEPADWRPDDETEPWIACLRTRHEWQHAVVAVGNRLFFDPMSTSKLCRSTGSRALYGSSG